MADRTDQKTVERDSFADTLTEEFGEGETDAEAGSDGIVRSRLPTLESVFSPRTFLGRAVLLLVGAFGAGFLPFVGGVLAVALGVFGAAFLIGAVASEARYLETATAGGLLGGALALVQSFSIAIASGGGARLASIGIGVGLVASLLGLYFGRDLRAGLTKEIGGDDGPGY
jgi:hypothetical protein